MIFDRFLLGGTLFRAPYVSGVPWSDRMIFDRFLLGADSFRVTFVFGALWSDGRGTHCRTRSGAEYAVGFAGVPTSENASRWITSDATRKATGRLYSDNLVR